MLLTTLRKLVSWIFNFHLSPAPAVASTGPKQSNKFRVRWRFSCLWSPLFGVVDVFIEKWNRRALAFLTSLLRFRSLTERKTFSSNKISHVWFCYFGNLCWLATRLHLLCIYGDFMQMWICLPMFPFQLDSISSMIHLVRSSWDAARDLFCSCLSADRKDRIRQWKLLNKSFYVTLMSRLVMS